MSEDTKERSFHCYAKLPGIERTYAVVIVPIEDKTFADEAAFKEQLAVFFGTLWNQEVLVLEENEALDLRKTVFCAEIERRITAKEKG